MLWHEIGMVINTGTIDTATKIELIKLLIAHNANVTGPHCTYDLCDTIEAQEVAIAQLLLENGYSALHLAASSDNAAMVRLLLEHNAPVNTLCYGLTPLHLVSNMRVAQLLVQAGSPIDTISEENTRCPEIVEMLLQYNTQKTSRYMHDNPSNKFLEEYGINPCSNQ